MKFMSAWFRKKAKPSQKTLKPTLLESRQTGSCGGMSTTELKIRIELILNGIEIKHSIIDSVTDLARLSHVIQTQFLVLLSELSDLSMSHAYSFMHIYARALDSMNSQQHSEWIEQITNSLKAKQFDEAESLIQNYLNFSSQINKSAVSFSDVFDTLEKLVLSISHDELSIQSLEPSSNLLPYTNGKVLYIPASISLFDDYHDNYLLYKIITFHLFGQLESKTKLGLKNIEQGILEQGDSFLALFSKLETLRINQYLKNEFPGIWRNIVSIHEKLNIESDSEYFISEQGESSVFDSLAWIQEHGIKESHISPFPYQSDFSPEKLSYQTSEMITEPQPILMNAQDSLSEISQEEQIKNAERLYFQDNDSSKTLTSSNQSQSDIWDQLSDSLENYLSEQQQLKNDREPDSYLYPEWDISLKQYRQDWCCVKEIAIEHNMNESQSLDSSELRFIEHRIRKSLDQIINDQRLIRYQSDGDDIDIDAWVAAKSNATKHADDLQNLYIRNNKNSRDVAILFAVDISGSTAGWKNTIIKQSTWLLSKTLAKLNDQYAIYAFSGSGREHCHIYPVKTFKETYNKDIKQRVYSLKPQQYTRMGAAIRHLSKTLINTEAKTKILFILTDGKPDDVDSYRGHYGIEDTRYAFNEAKALRINPFVLTFDQEGMEYLPHMLGKKHFRLISNITMLPIEISSIFKQLTT